MKDSTLPPPLRARHETLIYSKVLVLLDIETPFSLALFMGLHI